MEWLSTFFGVLWVVIKWIFVIVGSLVAIVLAVGSLFSVAIAYDEKKNHKGNDSGWKFFCLIALILLVISAIFVLFGWWLLI